MATTVGMIKGNVVCDLTVQEEKECEGILTIGYWINDNEVDYMELENGKLKREEVNKMVQSGNERCIEIHSIMKRNITEYSMKRILLQQ